MELMIKCCKGGRAGEAKIATIVWAFVWDEQGIKSRRLFFACADLHKQIYAASSDVYCYFRKNGISTMIPTRNLRRIRKLNDNLI
jgi:hypothetical protein